MKFAEAIDQYIEDMRMEGRINSHRTERDYRGTLGKHCDDVQNRDPSKVGRDDIRRTLARWPNPNSRSKNHSILNAFYDWMVEEGLRDTNPGRQTRKTRRRKPQKYRLTQEEVVALLRAAHGVRERGVIYLGLCAGLRRNELRGLQGRHFERPGYVHVSSDIAKGGKERWVPISDELAPVVAELSRGLAPDDYAFCAQRWRDPGVNREKIDKRKHPASEQAIWRTVKRVAERAGVTDRVSVHTLRHAFAEGMSKHADLLAVSALLGHSDVRTTQVYLGETSPDELSAAVAGFSFGVLAERAAQLSRKVIPANPVEAPTGIEPV